MTMTQSAARNSAVHRDTRTDASSGGDTAQGAVAELIPDAYFVASPDGRYL